MNKPSDSYKGKLVIRPRFDDKSRTRNSSKGMIFEI